MDAPNNSDNQIITHCHCGIKIHHVYCGACDGKTCCIECIRVCKLYPKQISKSRKDYHNGHEIIRNRETRTESNRQGG